MMDVISHELHEHNKQVCDYCDSKEKPLLQILLQWTHCSACHLVTCLCPQESALRQAVKDKTGCERGPTAGHLR